MKSDGDHEALRCRHVADFEAMLPEYLDRIDWPADRVAGERRRALRALLAIAVDRSPWHRERLAGIDSGGFSEAQIASLPVMTKSDLMDNFGHLVTDPRLTRELCERHLEEAAAGGGISSASTTSWLPEVRAANAACTSTDGTRGRSAGRRWLGSLSATGPPTRRSPGSVEWPR